MKLLHLILLATITFSFSSCNNASNKNKKETIPDSSFVNTTWLLESMNGEKINYPADYRQNYIIFSSESDGFKFEGFAGCNTISGSYDVGDHGEIGIVDIRSTKKACSFSDLENNFIKMLKNITSYKIEGFYLTVFNGKNKIATFKDVKELSTH